MLLGDLGGKLLLDSLRFLLCLIGEGVLALLGSLGIGGSSVRLSFDGGLRSTLGGFGVFSSFGRGVLFGGFRLFSFLRESAVGYAFVLRVSRAVGTDPFVGGSRFVDSRELFGVRSSGVGEFGGSVRSYVSTE